MKSTSATLKALVTDANGVQQVMTLQELAQLKLMPDMNVVFVDAATGKPVENVRVRKDGDDLVFEAEVEGEIARVENYYLETALPTGETAPEGSSGSEFASSASGGAVAGSAVEAESASMLTTGQLVGGVVALGAVAAASSGGGGGGASSIPPSFTLAETGGADVTNQLAMQVGDKLVTQRDNADLVTGFLLNGEPIAIENLAAINGQGEENAYITDDFDSLEVRNSGVYLTREAEGAKLGLNLNNDNGQGAIIQGDIFLQADSVDVQFAADEDATMVYSEMNSISVVADNTGELELSNNGAEDFMNSLRMIHIESNGDSGGKAALYLSASSNYKNQPKTGDQAGDGFLDALQSITVIGSVDAAGTLSLSHSGSDNFMASLKSIRVEAAGIDQSADVSISASANQIEGDGETYLSGANFMPNLESITIISENEGVSLSLSHSGGDYFMRSLEIIEMQAALSAEFSLSASANNTYYADNLTYFKESPMDGDNFIQSLRSINMVTGDDDNSLSVSHSGSGYFMKSLQTINMESVGDVDLSISASANNQFADGDGEGRQLLGEHFMASLESITLTSTGDTGGTVSLSLSHSGGAFFMESLREIELTADDDVDISISASANLYHIMDWYNSYGELNEEALNLRGDNFMESLQSITMISKSDMASLSISHSGGENFMASLQTINLQSDGRAQLSISASPNRFDNTGGDPLAPGDEVTIQLTGDNFMQSLQTILVSSDGEGRASLSISNDGGDFFANALTEITVSSGDLGTYAAVVNLSNDAFDFVTTGIVRDGDNFMTMLETINAQSDSGAAEVTLANVDGENFLPALETVNLDGLYGIIELVGPMGKTSGDLTFDVTDVDDLAFIQTHGADFFALATTTLITEIGSGNLQYNAIFESGVGTLEDDLMATPDETVGRFVEIEVALDTFRTVTEISDGADYAGFAGIEVDTPSGWVSLGSNGIEDVFAYNDADMGDAVIGGFDDGLDQFDFSALGALFSEDINDQSAATAHVATDQGDILVTQSDDAAADAIVWLNTEGGATTAFADFEASIYIIDGSAMTWDSNDMMFGAV